MSSASSTTHECGYPTDTGACEREIADDRDAEYCFMHPPSGESVVGATSESMKGNQNAVGNSGGGAPESNENARIHGAYANCFYDDLLSSEKDAFVELTHRLGDPEEARDVGNAVAAHLLILYSRCHDPRFLSRWRTVVETFGLLDQIRK